MKVNNSKYIIISLLLLIGINSCSKESVEVIEKEKEIIEIPEVVEIFNYQSQYNYNLNIVYFTPSDVTMTSDAHKRMSEIFLHGQAFYKKHMEINGFGNKTFNLKVDSEKERVKMTFINGKHPKSNYPYEGGSSAIREEVESYFSENSLEYESDHFIIITAVPNFKNAAVPYYGIGKWCYALDYPKMDVKYLGDGTQDGVNATTYIGGLFHELGHALNLPHNKQKVSDNINSQKGTALMGAGNYTYGSSPTFLTKASSAILNNNQIFGDTSGEYYTGANLNISSIKAEFNDGNINLTGAFQTDVAVNYVCFYNDPDDTSDYNAITWASPVVNNNEFSIKMPLSELEENENHDYILKLNFNHVNGEISSFLFYYKIINGIPIFEFGDKNYLSREKWTIAHFSSEEASGEGNTGRAIDVLDNDPLTYWHSQWQQASPNYPHTLIVDMGENLAINGFSFLQRDGARKIKDIEIQVSNDNINWASIGDFVLKNINTMHHIQLDKEASFRYFKLIAKSAYDGEKFAALAEIKTYKFD